MKLTLRDTNSWLTILVFLMIFYQLLYTQYFLYAGDIHRIVHLGFALCVVLLAIAARAKRLPRRLVSFFLIIVSIGITVELVLLYPLMLGVFVLPPVPIMIGGSVALAIAFALCWWRTGWLFPILLLLAYAYAFLGPYFLPAGIRPPDVGAGRILAWTAADLLSPWGIYGELLSLMADYVWMFMIYGAFLQASGGLRFIQGVGEWFASKVASGPAMLSVVTSSMVGMVTGSTAANITITGAFTIPMMKSRGYTPEQAGAVELASSNGGQIMPPIMGVVAFLLAAFIGIPYAKVMIFAIPSALFYYLGVGLYVEIQARKQRLGRLETRPSGRQLLLDAPLFVIPLFVLVIPLLMGFSLPYVGFWSIISIIVTGVISHFLRRDARIDWQAAKESIVSGAVSASELTILAGVLGAMTAIIEMSGLGFNLGEYLISISGGNLLLLLFFAALVCLILGTGVPSIAAYLITATVLAAPITKLGVPPLLVHFFIFYFSAFSHLTPPVGIGLIVAQRLAKANYWGTAAEAMRASFTAFILPFFFVYNPVLLLQFQGVPALEVARQFAAVTIMILSLSPIFINYGLARLGPPERVLLSIAALTSLLSIVLSTQENVLTLIALVTCVIGVVINYRRSRARTAAS
ncbi:MAG: TRAP transporter fused permease subunit [Chloroflexi bacterium]|nr:TRAP transporter fused permease subunit [Chloroflexota bacterium]